MKTLKSYKIAILTISIYLIGVYLCIPKETVEHIESDVKYIIVDTNKLVIIKTDTIDLSKDSICVDSFPFLAEQI